MHFLFNLLKIKGLYVLQALIAYLQEVLHKQHWYNACVLCQLAAPCAFGPGWSGTSLNPGPKAVNIQVTSTNCQIVHVAS
jgi:hypothetical protein